jgi:hypothetical protein
MNLRNRLIALHSEIYQAALYEYYKCPANPKQDFFIAEVPFHHAGGGCVEVRGRLYNQERGCLDIYGILAPLGQHYFSGSGEEIRYGVDKLKIDLYERMECFASLVTEDLEGKDD